MGTLLFGPEDVDRSVDMPAVVEAVEGAFEAHANDESVMPAKTYVDLPQYNGDFRAMPAYVEESAGVKWVNVHPDNPEEFDLPTVMGVVIYNDPRNAYPLAIMDGTTITRLRTGAAAGVASKHLADPNSRTFGVIGAGVQAHTQLEAIADLFDLEKVVVNDIDEDAVQDFIDEESGRDFEVVSGTAEEAAGCDILSTITPSREPVVKREWVSDGTHINAIGADAEGKQELDPDILLDSKVIIDDWEQCSHSGEINVPISEGIFSREDVHSDLGSIVAGHEEVEPGDDITVFDSTGLAIQDIATARLIYETGNERGYGTEFQLVGEGE